MTNQNDEGATRLQKKRDSQKEAISTYIEQTKVLITLASAFVVAPAATVVLLRDLDRFLFVLSELAFVGSVLFGYVVFSTITGNQHKGVFNIYDCKTRGSSFMQIFCFLLGLVLFILMIYGVSPSTD